MTMEIEEAIEMYTSNAEYERTHGNLQGCLEFRQLVEWLKDYKRLKEQPEITWVTGTDGAKVAFWDVPIPKVLKICEILQEPTITSTEDNAEMTYPQVEGITPTVVEPIPDVDKKIESYKKLLKHPVIKHIMDMDETQEQLDFVQPHKRIPVTLTVSDDLISREAVEEIINDIRSCISVEGYWAILERLKKLPSVKPQEPCDVPDINDGKMSENSTGSKDVIWYSKRNYSEIVVEPQKRSE